MPSWKKVITSGSDASLNSLTVTTSVTASSYTGSFVGDGSGLTNLPIQSIDTGSFIITASFSDPIITMTKGDGSTFPVDLGGISSQSPQATHTSLTASILSGTTVTLPGGLQYLSSSVYEYIDVNVNGLKLRYDIDYIPISTTQIQYNLSIPSGSDIIYTSYKRP